ncbi:MAG: Rhodanese-related sulfurtransferase-like protein precursor [Dehalococcoidia bacterium]|nr:Rhodanese-related sulfurtransferase-like protein precursor [Dehalococcoidia bacterium]
MADIYPRPELLVDTQWLAEHIGDPDLRIIDARAASRYAAGHIRGAVNLPVARLDDPVNPVRSMPLPAARIATMLGGMGIGNGDAIVIYDDQGSLMSSRLFWVLDYYGHSRLSILNGGIAQWQADGEELTAETPQHPTKEYRAAPNPEKLALKSDVQQRLGQPQACFLDVRSREEFTGKMVQAARGGHIPGAVNVDWTQALTQEALPLFKEADVLSDIYTQVGATKDKEVITYCQGGMRAAHTYFVLRLLGYDKVRNYTGSWGEWGNDPSVPTEL